MLADSAVRPAAARAALRRTPRADVVVVFALALAVRLVLVARSSGGFTGDVGYDQSVYFTAADALTHGRLPYADFLLLHPPGLMLVLTPFALLARLIGDHNAFVGANVFFSGVGALNAALITRIAGAWGLRRRAGLAGGLFYAVWLSAAAPELGARLEPLGTLAFLVGVLALSRARVPSRTTVLAGAALGFAATVKIWWIVPLLVLLGWHGLVQRDLRTVRGLLGGAVASIVVVVAPFFVLAPGEMWRMVVTDQLGRNPVHSSTFGRLFEISSLGQFGSTHYAKAATAVLVVVVVGLVAVVIVAAAWRQRAARPFLLVAAVQLVVLLVSPSYFGYYSGYVAPGVALVVAAAAGTRATRAARLDRLGALLVAVVVLVAGGVTASAIAGTARIDTPKPLAVGDLPARIRTVGCVVADSPMALIALDTLSRNLAAGCPNWGDVTGRTYDVDASPGRHVVRHLNARWQRDVKAYLLSGQAVVVIRNATGLSPATRAAIDRLPILARHGRIVVHLTTGAAAAR